MKKISALLILLMMLFTSVRAGVISDLQDQSVTVQAGNAEGSGVTVVRKNRVGKDIVFVWTAGHVVEHLRWEKNGVVRFHDALIMRRIVENGREVGKLVVAAQVLRYSNPSTGEDLALLRVRESGFGAGSAKFYLDEAIPEIGTQLFHVGSLLGAEGAGSFSVGHLSQIGRLFVGTVFDQTSTVVYPGSSGGGVFLQDGRYVGMAVRATGPQFNFIVPIRRIREWAISTQVAWALDEKIPLPSDEELGARLISPEDPGKNLPIDPDENSAHFLIRQLD